MQHLNSLVIKASTSSAEEVVYVPEPGHISIPSSLPSTKAHAVMYVVVLESVGTDRVVIVPEATGHSGEASHRS